MIVRLEGATPSDPSVIGGKGMGLVRLLAAGLPVPDAWCIPAAVSLDEQSRDAFLVCVPGADVAAEAALVLG